MTDKEEYRRLYYILKKREQRFSASKEWSKYDKVLKSGLFDLEAPKDVSEEDAPFIEKLPKKHIKISLQVSQAYGKLEEIQSRHFADINITSAYHSLISLRILWRRLRIQNS